MLKISLSQLALSTVSFTCLLTYPVSAQIIPDNSLGSENSIVTPNVTVKDTLADLIEGGAIRGNNLFHSFEQFNVNNGGNVYFANPDGIANILTRVTGNNTSEIFGTLGVDGAANLFLLNPNGIVFGENAVLDVSGSFLATTADSYVFENGFEYSASNPDVPPLLTINLPVGVQFGNQAESIVNQSLSFNEFDESVGLEVPPESNLTLVGGDINFEGGMLTAPNGSIEIGSVAPNNRVNLSPKANSWTLDYAGVDGFQDVNLTDDASINSSGDGAGQIHIHANKLDVLDGSTIFADNYGIQNGGSLTIQTQELVRVMGTNGEGNPGIITADSYGEGEGGNLTINTENLLIKDGVQIAAGTWGIGNSGNLIINATKVEVIGTSPDGDYASGIFTDVAYPEATGNGGNLSITTQELQVLDGALIAAGTLGNGDSGDLSITAQELQVFDGARIVTDAVGSGDGGNLLINVERLALGDEISQIIAATWDSGNAGDIIILASESIDISGTGLDFDFDLEELDIFSSGLFASVEPGATGNGGNLIVETDNLNLSDGAKIVTNTLGEGDAGDISIRANNLELRDTVVDLSGTRSGINSTVEPQGIGNGGNLEIITNNLSLIDGGSIAADSLGEGNAGNIDIQAQNINISGVSADEPVLGIEQRSLPSSISAFSQGDFAAGSIAIDSNNLNLNHQGNISVSNLGNGDSGNLDITAGELNLDNSATIEAEVNAGSQGNINLTTDDIFLRDHSEINAKATGTATGGNITINNTDNIVLLDNSQIIADAIEGNGGNIDITTQGLFVSPDSLISASSEFGLDGNVEIKEVNGDRKFEFNQLPDKISDITNLITVTCSAADNNAVALIGNGGIPKSPYQAQSLNTTWYDLRPVKQEQNEIASQPAPLTEATTTMIDANGELALVALTPLSTHRWVNSSCSN